MKKNKGFTLIELLIVIAVLGIITVVGLNLVAGLGVRGTDNSSKIEVITQEQELLNKQKETDAPKIQKEVPENKSVGGSNQL